MSKQQYRSELSIMKEILATITEHGENGALISTVSRMVNLSHYGALEKCQKLLDAGLIAIRDNVKTRLLVATEDGINCLQHIQAFALFIEASNLKF